MIFKHASIDWKFAVADAHYTDRCDCNSFLDFYSGAKMLKSWWGTILTEVSVSFPQSPNENAK